MLPRNVITKTLWENRRALISWALGITLAGLMYSSMFPMIKDTDLTGFADAWPKSLRDAFNLDEFSSAAGYLGSSPLGLIVPFLALFRGTAVGARAIAGDEEAGYLDLLLAHPISRTRLVLQRFAALIAGAVGISILLLLGLLATRSAADLGSISVSEFTAQMLNLALFDMFFGALAICIGGFVGQRGVVFGVTAAIGVLSYVANSFGEVIHLGWTKHLSAFYYYIGHEPLKNGFQWVDAGILLGAAAVLLAIGTWAFNRRDIAV